MPFINEVLRKNINKNGKKTQNKTWYGIRHIIMLKGSSTLKIIAFLNLWTFYNDISCLIHLIILVGIKKRSFSRFNFPLKFTLFK